MQIIEGNRQQLDGGAMFGHAPKELWKRWVTPDERNCIPLATRSLLLQNFHGKNLLFDVGVGAFFSPEMRKRYGVIEEEHILLKNLEAVGVPQEKIDGVILSHLHFDHAGGILSPYGEPQHLLFPNATFYTGKEHWDRAKNPHRRERASFIPEIQSLLEESKRIKLIDSPSHPDLPGITFHISNGHTIGLLISEIEDQNGPIVFISDLVPGIAWLRLSIAMGYDRFPEKTLEEKKHYLEIFYKKNAKFIFPHDPEVACAKIIQDEKRGYVEAKESL